MDFFHYNETGGAFDYTEFSFHALGKAFWEAKCSLIIPVIILGGIYGGILQLFGR